MPPSKIEFTIDQQALDIAPVAVGFYAIDGRCIFANEAYANLVGTTRDALLTQNFNGIQSWQRCGLIDAANRTLATGTPERLEVELVTTFGRKIWSRTELARVTIKSEAALLLIASDLTQLKLREQDLVAALQESRDSNDVQSRFLAAMSHELRTPLNAILGFSEMLGSKGIVEVNTQRGKEYADDIHSSARYLLNLVDDILDLSRLEYGYSGIEVHTFDPAPVILNAVRLCKNAALEKQISVSTNLGDHTLSVIGDPRSYQQALVNLLSNAIKFTHPGKPITIALARRMNMICASVLDTGIGIPASDLPHLGQPFRQVNRRDGKLYPGTGLGLAITKSLMERQAGQLIIESTEGVGTCARLLLPATHS